MAISDVIDYLGKTPGWHSVKEISEAIDMVATNVNKHLIRLLKDKEAYYKLIKHPTMGAMMRVWKLC